MKAILPLLLTVLSSLAARPASAALDFTLQHKAMTADGLAQDKPYITDGDSKIFLDIPANWKVLGGGGALECVPDTPDSSIILGSYQGSKLLTIDQAGGRDLTGLISAELPKDAKNARVTSITVDPLPIFGWKTLEATVDYELFGQALRRSILYVSMTPGRVVELKVIAPEAVFDKVHKQARHLLSSWFEPTRDLPPDLQRIYEAGKAVGG
jgi:hypothetical protein